MNSKSWCSLRTCVKNLSRKSIRSFSHQQVSESTRKEVTCKVWGHFSGEHFFIIVELNVVILHSFEMLAIEVGNWKVRNFCMKVFLHFLKTAVTKSIMFLVTTAGSCSRIRLSWLRSSVSCKPQDTELNWVDLFAYWNVKHISCLFLFLV